MRLVCGMVLPFETCQAVDRSHSPCLPATYLQTKWTVSATVLAVLLWQHNEYAAWCVMGAVLSSLLCKVSTDDAACVCRRPGTPCQAHSHPIAWADCSWLAVWHHVSLAGWEDGQQLGGGGE